MKITIIGSTAYDYKMKEYANTLIVQGHYVELPVFDSHPNASELEICVYNRNKIEWADEVHVIWDNRSVGTIFDLGMCLALRKKIKIVYLNEKTFANLMQQMEEDTN